MSLPKYFLYQQMLRERQVSCSGSKFMFFPVHLLTFAVCTSQWTQRTLAFANTSRDLTRWRIGLIRFRRSESLTMIEALWSGVPRAAPAILD